MVGDVKELYKAPPSPNKELAHINTWDLSRILVFNTRSETDYTRGIGDWDERLDWYEIPDEKILQNCACVAAICTKDKSTEKRSTCANPNPFTINLFRQELCAVGVWSQKM